jgi:hypothetical protein
MPNEDNGLAADFRGNEISRIGDLTIMANVNPSLSKNSIHFQFE